MSAPRTNERLTTAGADIVGRLLDEHRDGRPRQARGDPARPGRARQRRSRPASRTCPGRRRRCSRGRSRAASRTRSRRASSARPTCSRPTSRASPSSTRSTRKFEFQPGPLFANIVLVDEINRAMPKTQSALLEAMAEHQVTVDGVTRPLPDPFLLIATENPIEYEGTFPLPEAQLDRFFLRTSLGYPGEEQELEIVREQRHGHPLDGLDARGLEGRDRRAAPRLRGRLRRRAARRVDRQARARRHARCARSRSARPCAARSRSSRRRAPGRFCTDAPTCRPRTSSSSSSRCSATGSCWRRRTSPRRGT